LLRLGGGGGEPLAPSSMFSRLVAKLRRMNPSPAGPNSVPLRTAMPRSSRNWVKSRAGMSASYLTKA
jgi:hypothetical protein